MISGHYPFFSLIDAGNAGKYLYPTVINK